MEVIWSIKIKGLRLVRTCWMLQAQEISHLIACQPVALKAVRLQALLPPYPDTKDRGDRLDKLDVSSTQQCQQWNIVCIVGCAVLRLLCSNSWSNRAVAPHAPLDDVHALPCFCSPINPGWPSGSGSEKVLFQSIHPFEYIASNLGKKFTNFTWNMKLYFYVRILE